MLEPEQKEGCVDVSASTVRDRLSLLQHARIIFALMHPVLMLSPKPSETSASFKSGGKLCMAFQLSSVQGHRDQNENERKCQHGNDGGCF